MHYHLVVTLPLYLFMHAGLAGIFRKANVPMWKAFVPILNVYEWLLLVGRPKWWVIWFMIPVLNLVMGIGIILDLVRSFGKHRFRDQAAAVLLPFGYFLYLGFNKDDQYQGKWTELAKTTQIEKSGTREWLDAILFAGVAALCIRAFMLEAFMIPTTSMEGSLLAGDFLFVSKFHYGIRLPQAPLSFPFVHNTLPFTKGVKSFIPLELPYSRLPGLKDVERNEIVVFNYPDDDVHPDVPDLGEIHITSMKQNYIKRCVAVAGDTFEIRDKQIFINGQKGWNPERLQYSYFAEGLGGKTLEKMGFRTNQADDNKNADRGQPGEYPPGVWKLHMDDERLAEIKKKFPTIKITPIEEFKEQMGEQRILRQQQITNTQPKYMLFPKVVGKYMWTLDDFGPIWIPKAGETITLTQDNYHLYRKAIDVYEDHDFEVKGGKFYIDGAESNTYTFEMDYYFMMGDNRHASLDSRYWGFVPEDHVIGRPWFVLFSWEGGPRFDRFLNGVGRFEPQ